MRHEALIYAQKALAWARAQQAEGKGMGSLSVRAKALGMMFLVGFLVAMVDKLQGDITLDAAGIKRLVSVGIAAGLSAILLYIKQSPLLASGEVRLPGTDEPHPVQPVKKEDGFLKLFLVLIALASLTACGSKINAQFGGDKLLHPDSNVVFYHVCTGGETAARIYLNSPTYAWLGPQSERYMTDALLRKLNGDCPCPRHSCEGLTLQDVVKEGSK